MRVVSGVVVLDVAFAWLFTDRALPRRLTRQLTAPLYAPIQRVFDPSRTGVDFSPMVVVMVLWVAAWVIAPEFVEGR